MIISKQKPFDNILDILSFYRNIFLVGCSLCATVCLTGGENEAVKMKDDLIKVGKKVTGYKVVNAACHLLETKKELRGEKGNLKAADAILSLTCGAGTQAIASISNKPVFTAVDTMFLGVIERWGHFVEVCEKCGDCLLNFTGGICPIARCPKGILNGPCGGMNKGKCEVDPQKGCCWVEIYDVLKRQGRLEVLKKILPPRDNSKKPGSSILILSKGNEKEQYK